MGDVSLTAVLLRRPETLSLAYYLELADCDGRIFLVPSSAFRHIHLAAAQEELG